MRTQRKVNIQGPVATVFASANTGSWRIERPKVDFAACIGCGTCARYCPVGAVTLDRGREACVEIDWNYCKGCGICANECPKDAIAMVPERGE